MGNIVGTVLGILLVIGILLVSPFITIWALNTLFSLQIEYGLATYFATLWLTSIVTINATNRNKS